MNHTASLFRLKPIAWLIPALALSACQIEISEPPGQDEPGNTAPTAEAGTQAVAAGDTLTMALSATDADDDPLTYALVTDTTYGEITLDETTGEATYNATSGFNGTDYFTFRVNDGTEDSNTARVDITVSSDDAGTAAQIRTSLIGAQTTTVPLDTLGLKGDNLAYEVTRTPQHGNVSLDNDQAIVTLDADYEGFDEFDYRVTDGLGNSRHSTVRLQAANGQCQSAQFDGPSDALIAHLPLHLADADISGADQTVTVADETGDTWQRRTHLEERQVTLDLAQSHTMDQAAITLKFMPDPDVDQTVLLQSQSMDVRMDNGQVVVDLHGEDGLRQTVTVPQTPDTYTCNRLTLNLNDGFLNAHLNDTTFNAELDRDVRDLEGEITLGRFSGRVWDLRLYDRALTESEHDELAEDCVTESALNSRHDGYPNFQCGVYVCEFWPDDMADTTQDNLDYYIHAQDEVFERHIIEAGMYSRDNYCDYALNGAGTDLILSDGIRRTYVNNYSFDSALGYGKSGTQYWLHENFHSFQGNLARYNGFGRSKFMLESTASWGPFVLYPGVTDDLLGYYTFHPHITVWAIQNSPVDDQIGSEFKGGHQYGAGVFWYYLSEYVGNNFLIGDVFNDRNGGTELEVTYNWLADRGISLEDAFIDFASRITTWDLEAGEYFAQSEQVSLNRMKRQQSQAERFDAKISQSYDQAGTGAQWTSLEDGLEPGSWAFNAYQLSMDNNGSVTAKVRVSDGNPDYSDFRAQIVVHSPDTGERQYHDFEIRADGTETSTTVDASAGDEVYLVVATTPNIFSGWDTYQYDYQFYGQ